jgi:hypothetical protein
MTARGLAGRETSEVDERQASVGGIMKEHSPANQLPPPCLAGATATGGWARWVRDKWPAVRVTHVKTVPLPADTRGPARVRVNVHLGALTPADVLVEATVNEADGRDASDGAPIRLCSIQSYGNGTYVFDGLLPRQTDDAHLPLMVRVRPAASHKAVSTLRDVVRLGEFHSGSARAVHKRRTQPEPAVVTD